MPKPQKNSERKSHKLLPLSGYEYEDDNADDIGLSHTLDDETTQMLGTGHKGAASPGVWDMLLCRKTSRHQDAESFSGETALLRGMVLVLIAFFLFCTSAFVVSASAHGLDTDGYDVWMYEKTNATKTHLNSGSVPSSSNYPSEAYASLSAVDRIEAIFLNMTGQD